MEILTILALWTIIGWALSLTIVLSDFRGFDNKPLIYIPLLLVIGPIGWTILILLSFVWITSK